MNIERMKVTGKHYDGTEDFTSRHIFRKKIYAKKENK